MKQDELLELYISLVAGAVSAVVAGLTSIVGRSDHSLGNPDVMGSRSWGPGNFGGLPECFGGAPKQSCPKVGVKPRFTGQ